MSSPRQPAAQQSQPRSEQEASMLHAKCGSLLHPLFRASDGGRLLADEVLVAVGELHRSGAADFCGAYARLGMLGLR